MKKEFLDALNLIFSGLTAVGTVGAVALALYFSRQDSEPKLKITARYYRTYLHSMDYIIVIGTNIGKQSVSILRYRWYRGFLKKKVAYQNATRNIMDASFAPGEQIKENLPLNDFLIDANPLFPISTSKSIAKIQLHFLKIKVELTTGHTFKAKIHSSLNQKILDRYFSDGLVNNINKENK